LCLRDKTPYVFLTDGLRNHITLRQKFPFCSLDPVLVGSAERHSFHSLRQYPFQFVLCLRDKTPYVFLTDGLRNHITLRQKFPFCSLDPVLVRGAERLTRSIHCARIPSNLFQLHATGSCSRIFRSRCSFACLTATTAHPCGLTMLTADIR
jgi:hypothetical protein